MPTEHFLSLPAETQAKWRTDYTISYPLPPDPDGSEMMYAVSADSLERARSKAISLSQEYRDVTITDLDGHVATYINGELWTSSAAPVAE